MSQETFNSQDFQDYIDFLYSEMIYLHSVYYPVEECDEN